MRNRYEQIGNGYARTRREDPRLVARTAAALSGVRSVVDVGAGAGSYEPGDRFVLAVEPSRVMIAQRDARRRGAVVQATAEHLPLPSRCVDAAMSVLSLHHWGDGQERGVRELRRVARGPVAIVTFDALVSGSILLGASRARPRRGRAQRDVLVNTP